MATVGFKGLMAHQHN